MPKALVTGATGMLGSHVVERLLAAGVEVRALARPSSDLRYLQTLPVEIRRTDSNDQAAIVSAVEGRQFVFHVAAHVNLGSTFGAAEDYTPYRRVNVDFTEALLGASRAARVERFIYVSTASVYGPTATAPIGEDAPLKPATNYGRSKLLAEERVRAHQRQGLAATIIRPCLIYGPRDRLFSPAILRLMQLPVLPLPDGGRRLLDLVYVGDVAELMWQVSQSGIADGKVYNAASGDPLSLRELALVLRELTGRSPRICSISPGLLRRFSRTARWYLRRFAPGLEVLLTPTGLTFMSQDVHLDMSQAEIDLGYLPKIDIKHGLAATFANYQG